MPTLADLLGLTQPSGGAFGTYSPQEQPNLTPGDVLTAAGAGEPWMDRARRQAASDLAAYQAGGVPQLMEQTANPMGLAGGFGGVTRAIGGPAALWHPISETKLARPISEFGAEYAAPSEIASSRRITPAELQGGLIMPGLGDRSMAQAQLLGVGGQQFANPVELQGGHGYMAANEPRGALWAGAPGATATLESRALGLSALGKPVYMSYTAMSPRAVDFSHHVSDTLAEMLPNAEIKRGDVSAFDKAMKTADADFPAVKDWPGVQSEGLRDYLANASGGTRNKFVKAMDKAQFRDAGFPSVPEARWAVTDPALLHEPTGAAGLSIGQITPGAARPAAEHATYEAALPGSYVGGFGGSIPKEVMYPDILQSYKRLGYEPVRYDYLMQRPPGGSIVAQAANQRWVDRVSDYMRSKGLLPAVAGAVTPAGVLMGAGQPAQPQQQ